MKTIAAGTNAIQRPVIRMAIRISFLIVIVLVSLPLSVSASPGANDQLDPLKLLEQAEAVARTVPDFLERDIVARRIGLASVVTLLKAGDFHAGLQKAESLPDFGGDEAKSSVAGAQVKAGDIAGARRTAAGIGRKYLPGHL